MLYLDHAASTYPYKQAVAEAFVASRDYYGNPSSTHKFGVEATRVISKARRQCANLIGAKASEIIFTSGGTESNNLALLGTLRVGDSVIVSDIEHSSILNTCRTLTKRGVGVTFVGVSNGGIVNLNEIENAITNRTKLISVMSANNEIGTLQPIHKIAEKRLDHNVRKVDLLFNRSRVPGFLRGGSLKGTGFLYVKLGTKLNPIIFGGSQERRLRAGTENVCGIVSMGVAAEMTKQKLEDATMIRVKKIRDHIQQRIVEQIPFVIVNGEQNYRLANILNLGFRFVDSGILIDTLSSDKYEIYVSGKSACTSADSKPSHVLTAIGLDKNYINGTIRISIDDSMTYKEANYFVDSLAEVVKMLRSYNPEYTGK